MIYHAIALPTTRVQGFQRGSPQDFRIKLVWDLARIPLEEVSMDYVKKHPAANRTRWITEIEAKMLEIREARNGASNEDLPD